MTQPLKFYKLHGLGNDYIYFDGVCEQIDINKIVPQTTMLCHRNKGIGGDGIVIIQKSELADFKMQIWNSQSGKEAEFCGNALRCVAYLIDKLGLMKQEMSIVTKAGIVKAKVLAEDVKVKMFYPPKVAEKEQKIKVYDKDFTYHFVDVGNPHVVINVDDLEEFNVAKYGSAIEQSVDIFPQGVNVEFYSTKNNELKMRVWERGAGETLACGSGACAVAAVYKKINNDTKIKVDMPGGSLWLQWEDDDFYMIGQVKFIYQGEVFL
jgi:diaminopimelate epimerase